MEEELIDILSDARKLSTWGPDFKDESVLSVWVKKLSNYEIQYVSKAIEQLNGKKEFPSPSDILELASSFKIREKKTLIPDEDPRRFVIKQILDTDEMKKLKEFRFEFYVHVKEDLIVKKYSVDKLNNFLQAPQTMINDIIPPSQGWTKI